MAPEATLICGDVIEVLDRMPEKSVHAIITSPPYYSLRRYMPDMVKLRSNLTDTEVTHIVKELTVLGISPV